MGRKVAAGLALVMGLILLYTAISSEREAALNASSEIQESWQRATDSLRTGDNASFDRYMERSRAEAKERENKEEIETVAGVVFLIAALALFKSGTKKATEDSCAEKRNPQSIT
jgi:hypothetical protein